MDNITQVQTAESTHSESMRDRAQQHVEEIFANKVSDKYKYHTIEHTMRVVRKLQEMAENSGCNEEEQEILAISALFHDAGFSESYDLHEDHSKRIAKTFLEQEGADPNMIREVLLCIESTKMSHHPANKMQMLLKDADTSSLGSRNFFEYTELLRQELNEVKGEQIDELGWNYINLQFMKEHKYYTEAARMRFGPMKKNNLKEIETKLGLKKNKKDRSKMVTIGTNKSAQTQFKTALRNHIDLSAIADNKANTMLSVTSLIISLSLPILGTNLDTSPHLLVPTIILLFVCVTAITYATLATRPMPMRGKTTMEDINQKQSNLFFFGNFFKMKYSDYEDGIKYVVSNDEFLDSSITRDLFFLGMALGRKYRYLRKCYNVFMYGIIASVVGFAIAFAWNAINSGNSTPIG